MIIIDTSAWVEFLRDTGSPVCEEVDRLLGSRCAVTDPVVMEVLAGARDDRHLRDLRGLLGRTQLLHSQSADYETAALLYRECRTQGKTVRRLVDCLIAAVAIRNKMPILQADSDFESLAQHTDLELAPTRR